MGIITRAEGAYRVHGMGTCHFDVSPDRSCTYRSEAISLANEVSKYRVAEGNKKTLAHSKALVYNYKSKLNRRELVVQAERKV